MAIQQKLHTKLVQKLILTPSLQQAIKLLPMTTIELADLLNQEVVENPLLEEIPTEDQQTTDATAQTDKPEAEPEPPAKTDSWDEQDYEYFFGEYLDDGYRPRLPQEVRELPPIENTLSTGTSLSDHLVWQLSLQVDDPVVREIGSAIIGNLDDDGYLVASVDEIAQMGSGRWRTSSARWRCSRVRSRRCRRPRPAGVPHAAVAPPRPAGHADRAHRLGAPPPAPEPPGAGDRQAAGPHHRGDQAAHRDHPAARPEAGQPLQPRAVAVRHPGRVRRQGRGSVRRGAQRRGAAAAAHQPGLPAAARQERRGQRRDARAT